MNIHDDGPDEQYPRPASIDPLAQRLHDEAMAERQRVSPDLHHLILKQIREEREEGMPGSSNQHGRHISKVAAAALVALGIVAASWAIRSYRPTPSQPPASIVRHVVPLPAIDQPAVLAAPIRITASVDVDGIFYARLWPPVAGINVPDVRLSEFSHPAQTQPASAASSPTAPDWLIAGLQSPPNSAQAALVELTPTNLRALIELVRTTMTARE